MKRTDINTIRYDHPLQPNEVEEIVDYDDDDDDDDCVQCPSCGRENAMTQGEIDLGYDCAWCAEAL